MPASKVDLKRKYSYKEWYELIQTSETKYEFVDGYLVDIRAMAGGTLHHNQIAANVIAEIASGLKGKPCRVLSSDQAVRAKQLARYRYPDLSVLCEKPLYDEDDKSKLVLLNVKLIVEVLSDSTEAMDRGEKMRDYLAIDALQQYVLISQHQALVESFTRVDDAWRIQHWIGLDAIASLTSIEVDLPLQAVYAGIELPKQDEANA